MSVCILIPAYNVEKWIEKLIRDCLRYVDNIFVIDDGSVDNTKLVLDRLKNELNINYITNPKNRGKAESIKIGLKRILEEDGSIELIVQMDADYAHSPHEIPSLISYIKDLNCDMVIGNRYAKRKLDSHRFAIIRLASILVKELTGYKLIDPMCGYRVFTKKLGEIFVDKLSAHGYGLETEQILISRFINATIREYDLTYVVEQNPFTKAVEFIDVFQVLINYLDNLNTLDNIKQQLSLLLEMLLQRKTFTCTIKNEQFTFKYLPDIDSYTLTMGKNKMIPATSPNSG